MPSPNLRDKRTGWILEQMQRSAWLGWCRHPLGAPPRKEKTPHKTFPLFSSRSGITGHPSHNSFSQLGSSLAAILRLGRKASYRFHLFLCRAPCLAPAARYRRLVSAASGAVAETDASPNCPERAFGSTVAPHPQRGRHGSLCKRRASARRLPLFTREAAGHVRAWREGINW